MSALGEMWSTDDKPYNPGGWFCCRTKQTRSPRDRCTELYNTMYTTESASYPDKNRE